MPKFPSKRPRPKGVDKWTTAMFAEAKFALDVPVVAPTAPDLPDPTVAGTLDSDAEAPLKNAGGKSLSRGYRSSGGDGRGPLRRRVVSKFTRHGDMGPGEGFSLVGTERLREQNARRRIAKRRELFRRAGCPTHYHGGLMFVCPHCRRERPVRGAVLYELPGAQVRNKRDPAYWSRLRCACSACKSAVAPHIGKAKYAAPAPGLLDTRRKPFETFTCACGNEVIHINQAASIDKRRACRPCYMRHLRAKKAQRARHPSRDDEN